MAEIKKALFDKKFVGDPVDIGTSDKRYDGFLLDGEKVEMEFKGLRDALVFTSLRLLLIDPKESGVRNVRLCLFPGSL